MVDQCPLLLHNLLLPGFYTAAKLYCLVTEAWVYKQPAGDVILYVTFLISEICLVMQLTVVCICLCIKTWDRGAGKTEAPTGQSSCWVQDQEAGGDLGSEWRHKCKGVSFCVQYLCYLPVPWALRTEHSLFSLFGVGVPWNRSFGLESESLIWKRLRLRPLSVSSGLLCNCVAVCLTFVQFIW